MSNTPTPRGLLLGAVGGLIGGVVGYYLFGWVLGWGFYAMMIPGAAIGMGVGRCSGERSVVYGILAAIAGLGLGVFTEWSFRPFRIDPSLSYFVSNLHKLTPISQLMIVLGAVFAYWLGQGRERYVRTRPESESTEDAAES